MTEVTDFYESVSESELAQAIDNSLKADYKKWFVTLDDMNTTIGKLREWFPARAHEIDSLMTTLNTVDGDFTYDPDMDFDGIQEPKSNKHTHGPIKVLNNKHLYIIKDGETYSVDGKRIK